MADLRAGLIGLGMMGRHHARVLSSLEGVDLAAVADPAGDKFGSVAGLTVFESVEQLMAKNLDYCVVAVPTAFHQDIANKLADNGIHALVEKPLSSDLESAEQMAQKFERSGLIGGVGHIERFNAALQQARARIASGFLGEIYHVATRRQGPFPGRIADVGVAKDLGTHDFDLTAWVTQQNYTEVSAQTVHASERPHEDLVSVVGRLDGGAVSNHLINWLSPFKERTIIFTGERGAFVADTLTADLTYFANGEIATTWSDISRFRGVSEGDVVRYAFPKPEPLLVEHQNFRDCILGKPNSTVTFAEGARTVSVAEACIDSANRKRLVKIPTRGA